MGYKSFREVYHKLAIVLDNGFCATMLNTMQEKIIPDGIELNSALVYGYIDKICGFSYKVLGLTYYEDGDYTLVWPNEEVGLTVRGENFHNFAIIPIENKALEKRYSRDINLTNECYSNDKDEKLRSFTELDKFRHYDFPDDVLVILFRNGKQPEQIWVRVTEFVGKGEEEALFFKGNLLNEPYEDYGVHSGDEVVFFVCESKGDMVALCSPK